ncbi:hypothetical protein TMatcc_003523 [Talaromyces marneffei ATCC 18224]
MLCISNDLADSKNTCAKTGLFSCFEANMFRDKLRLRIAHFLGVIQALRSLRFQAEFYEVLDTDDIALFETSKLPVEVDGPSTMYQVCYLGCN